MTRIKNFKKEDFIFDLIPNSGFIEFCSNRAEVKFENYIYEIDLSGHIYFKTKLDLYRLDDYGISFRAHGLTGLIDNNGKMTIQPKYQNILTPLRGGNYYSFRDNNKWGLIDRYGNIKVPAIYDGEFEYLESNYYIAYTMDGDGVIDENGNIILPFEYYDCSISLWDERENKFTALKNENKKCGVVNLKNETVIPFMYDWIEKCFTKGKYKDCSIAKLNGKEGIINQHNEVIIPFICEYIKALSDNTFLICKNEGEGEYIVDSDFNQVSDKKFLEIVTGYDYITTDYFIASSVNNKYDENKEGLIDKSGNIVIDFKYEDLSMTENPHSKFDFYLYAKNNKNKWGLIDKNENIILPFEFDNYSAFKIDSDNTAVAIKNGKYGVINIKNKNVIVDFIFDTIYPFDNKNATLAKYKGKWGAINKQGNSISFNLDNAKEIKL